MKYILSYIFFIFLQISFANSNPNWGTTGHRALGEIAEKHLSKKVQRKIDKLLNGQSLAFISTYGDEIKSDKKFRKFSSWHYVNFPFNKTYEESEKSLYGDLIVGIETCTQIIKNKESSKEDKIFYLKMLVHLIGDLHQPLHVGRAKDKGGNMINVTWHGKKTNLHRVWDENMIQTWNMSYLELSNNTTKLENSQIKKIQSGTVTDWVNETQKLAILVYKSAKDGDRLHYKYSYNHFGIVRSQLQKGGIRLAKILTDIFD